MNEVLVIGHRNPDTDAICSAIGYAEFKRLTGMPEAVAARCGDINERTEFVLDFFRAPAPRFVPDVRPKVRDVMQANVVSVKPHSTVARALMQMDEGNIRVLPVLNEDQTCRGFVSVFKMSKFFFPSPNRLFNSRTFCASLRNLAETLGAKVIHEVDPEREEDLVLMVGAMSVESFQARLPKYSRERIVVVVGDRRDIQTLAISEGVRVVVVTGGLPIEADVVQRAIEGKVSLLSSPHDSATTAMLSRASIAVRQMLDGHFLAFREDEPIAEAEPIAAASNLHAFPVLDQEKRMVGILSKSDFLRKVPRQLILVDHNELSQAVNGAEQVEILEVIDHHRLGLNTTHPILFRNEPVGSTSTIVADCFLRQELSIAPQTAGLLLAGIISDTLNLTSPTTTEKDAAILSMLEKIAGVNAREFTDKLFASGSVLIGKPAVQAIAADCKEYKEGGRVFSVAQIEEIGFTEFWKRKAEVLGALEEFRKEHNYFFSALLVTDVARQSSLLLVSGRAAFLKQIGYPEIEPGIYELEGVVSRKKQLLPYLIHSLRPMAA
jgi:manganese-dependent inorganic pyrophosphatase